MVDVDSLKKIHTTTANTLIRKLLHIRSNQNISPEDDEELEQVCLKLADVFSLDSFARAIEIVRAKIGQAKAKAQEAITL